MSTAVGDEPVADAPPVQQEAAQDASDLFGGLKKKSGKKKKIPMDFDFGSVRGVTHQEKPAEKEAAPEPVPTEAPKQEEEPPKEEPAPADDGALDVRTLTDPVWRNEEEEEEEEGCL